MTVPKEKTADTLLFSSTTSHLPTQCMQQALVRTIQNIWFCT